MRQGFLKGELWGAEERDGSKGSVENWLRLGLGWGCSGRTSEGIHVGKEELLEVETRRWRDLVGFIARQRVGDPEPSLFPDRESKTSV